LLYGSQPNDGGAISDISPEEASAIRKSDAIAAKFLKRVVGARELLHKEERWCLWLVAVTPTELRQSKVLSQRVEEVKASRESSSRKATQELASTPHLFGFISHPQGPYLAVPRHSSEERDYVPIAYFDENTVCTDAVSIVPEATLATFGLMSSSAFNVWNKAISGRLESRVRISGGITYNNFPFPELNDADTLQLEKVAKEVLDARMDFQESSLADLYGGVSMPIKLKKAHETLDATVLSLLGINTKASNSQILASLFVLYSELQARPLL
jgi:hypothetical protein